MKIHTPIGLTGGGMALDGIRTAAISANEMAYVQMPNKIGYVYRYSTTTTLDESDPAVIVPNDNTTGTGAWLKVTPESTGTSYGVGHWRYTTASGVQPGSASASGTVPLNDEVLDEVTTAGTYPDGSFQVKLVAGDYNAWWYCSFYKSDHAHCTLYNADDTAQILDNGSTAFADAGETFTDCSIGFGQFTLAAEKDCVLNYYVETTASATLGYSSGVAGLDEVHAELVVWRIG